MKSETLDLDSSLISTSGGCGTETMLAHDAARFQYLVIFRPKLSFKDKNAQ